MPMNNQHSILVVEDDADQRKLVCELLSINYSNVHAADSVEQAIVMLKHHTFDAIFSDWKLGQLSGLDLLNYVRANQPELGFVIATAYGTISHAVEAMQQGADDYLAKPFQRQELLLTVEKALTAKTLRHKNAALTEQLGEQKQLVKLVGKAGCMQKVYQRVEKVSATDATVLVLGESGTGKELTARALHEYSRRSKRKVYCH